MLCSHGSNRSAAEGAGVAFFRKQGVLRLKFLGPTRFEDAKSDTKTLNAHSSMRKTIFYTSRHLRNPPHIAASLVPTPRLGSPNQIWLLCLSDKPRSGCSVSRCLPCPHAQVWDPRAAGEPGGAKSPPPRASLTWEDPNDSFFLLFKFASLISTVIDFLQVLMKINVFFPGKSIIVF